MELEIDKLQKQAVDAALSANWEKAIQLNKKIIEIDPDQLDAHLSLGFAYMQVGNHNSARKMYKLALDIDPINTIARNNLDKILILSKKAPGEPQSLTNGSSIKLNAETFINVRGKTKVLSLINVGKPELLAMLKTGEKVEIKIKKRRIEIRTMSGEYIGALPDDISKRLMFFLDGKSTYSTFIKSSTKSSVDVFIREEKKGSKVRHFVSFPENIQDDLKKIITESNEDKSSDENSELSDEESENKDTDSSDDSDDEEINDPFVDIDSIASDDSEDIDSDFMNDLDTDDEEEYEEDNY